MMSGRLLRRLLGVAAIGVVLGLTVLVSLDRADGILRFFSFVPGDDGVRHFIVMGLLSAGVNFGFHGARVGGRRLGVAWLTGLVLVLVTLEEYSQAFIPGRRLQMDDWGAGVLGVFLGAALVTPLLRRCEGAGGSV